MEGKSSDVQIQIQPNLQIQIYSFKKPWIQSKSKNRELKNFAEDGFVDLKSNSSNFKIQTQNFEKAQIQILIEIQIQIHHFKKVHWPFHQY